MSKVFLCGLVTADWNLHILIFVIVKSASTYSVGGRCPLGVGCILPTLWAGERCGTQSGSSWEPGADHSIVVMFLHSHRKHFCEGEVVSPRELFRKKIKSSVSRARNRICVEIDGSWR